jgi:Mg2+/citrate symporter
MNIEHNPSNRQLKVFGLLWLLVFGTYGILTWMKTGITIKTVALGITAVLVPGLGLVWSEFLRKVYVLASYATYPIGATVSLIMLAVIYYGVVTPVGLVLRLVRYDPLKRRSDRSAGTYWMSRKPERETKRYFQQF